jgi:glucokinase
VGHYPKRAMLAGIDLGGTQVRVALARSDGRLVASIKTKTGLFATPQSMVDWAAGEIDRHRGREKVRSITIAAPGPIDLKRGVLVNPPNLPWQNVPLVALMARATGAKVHLANDADMAGLGEFHHGAGRGSRNMVYITWSTGVGGGLIIDGKLHRGAHGTAGEIGHMIIDPNGPLDNCGQRGCLEAFVSGTALARETGKTAAELFAAAARGDRRSQIVVERAARYMGTALISLTNTLDPELFVMGGGVSRSWTLVYPTMIETLRSSPFIKPARRPRLRRARLGDRAGQVGAVEWARINQ